ncbi:MAG: hypothetical protein JXR70_14715 [Spirochaetales bacterium]|nr:hypothetical protein [Spirochaetales bacterium]
MKLNFPGKKLIILVSVLILLFTVAENGLFANQHGHKNSRYFLLRDDEKTISLNEFVNESVSIVASYSAPETSIYGTDGIRFTAIFNPEKMELAVIDFEDGSVHREEVPFQALFHTIMVHNGSIFLGGEKDRGTKLVRLDLKTMSWSASENPVRGRKAIDDLILDKDYLIAVDNVVFPKYILYYKLGKDGQISFSHKTSLRFIGGFEEIQSARIQEKKIGIFSTTLKKSRDNITVYNKDNFKDNFFIISSEAAGFKDFLLSGDNLIIATRNEGLIRVDYKQKKDNSNPDLVNATSFDRLKINFEKNESLTSLTEVPGSDKMIVSLKNEFGKFRQVVFNPATENVEKSAGKLWITPYKKTLNKLDSKQPPEQMRILVKGIIGDANSLTAIIEDKDGNSFTVKKNENIEKLGIKIVDIMKDRIVIFSSKKKKRRTFMLDKKQTNF